MITAVDTNILSGLWSREPLTAAIVMRLQEARLAGALVVTGIAYAELLAYPGATELFVRDFFSQAEIRAEFDTTERVWMEAGRRFALYAQRRRLSKDNEPKRMLADFVIGAHALLHADRLMTLDPKRYAQDFPELRLFAVGA